MAIVQDDSVRLKITDSTGDSVFTHGVFPDGSAVIHCHEVDTDHYAGVLLTNEERLALIERLTRPES